MNARSSPLTWIAFALIAATSATPAVSAGGRQPSAAAAWLFSGWGGDADRDWDPGFGFALTGNVPLGRTLDLRADWGPRWLEGSDHAPAAQRGGPRWGGGQGLQMSGLRVMPASFSLVYRFERWSQGRFWVPYFGLGPGLYDMRATFREPMMNGDRTASDLAPPRETFHNLSRFGWHARAGASFYRTSGIYLDLSSAVHYVDVPGAWSPLWEVSLGVGTLLSGPTR